MLTLGSLTVRLLVVHADARAPRVREMHNKGNAEFHQRRMRPETIQISYKVAIYVHIGGGEEGREREHAERNTNKTDPMFSLFCQSWIHAPVSLTGENTYITFSQGPLPSLDMFADGYVSHQIII